MTMNLTRLQKIALAFFIVTLLPAYLFANWRHSVNLTQLDAAYAREQDLHESTDKLMSNCARNDTPYDANQQICNHGQRLHAQTALAMDTLANEKQHNDSQWHRSFGLAVLIFNLLGWLAYKGRIALSKE